MNIAADAPVAIDEIRKARERISGRILRTPMTLSRSLSERIGVPVHLKHEQRQTTGSFKLRGATNALAALPDAVKRCGVVAASTGNHGRGLAFAAKGEGMRAVICMSKLVPDNKVSEIRRLGAEVRIVGNSQDDAQVEVDRLVKEDGFVMIPPFDHRAVVAGQGTVALEILEDAPQTATILVPLSGGGLAAGIAAAAKAGKPGITVIGVSMARGAAMKASLDAGHPVQVEELPTLADTLGGGIGLDNRLTFRMCRDLLDGVVLLDEDEIAAGIRHAYGEEREIVEGGGAVGIGALLSGKVKPTGPVCVLLSGGNIDMALHRKVICGEAVS